LADKAIAGLFCVARTIEFLKSGPGKQFKWHWEEIGFSQIKSRGWKRPINSRSQLLVFWAVEEIANDSKLLFLGR